MAVTLKGNNGTYEGESTDIKPLDVPVNTEFNELDTGKTYYFDGETWNEEPPCEGSGFTPTEQQLAAMNSGITAEKLQADETALAGKVDKETGKGLSANDFTTVEKTKLAGIAEGAEVNEIDGIKVNNTTINPDANKVVNITVPTTAADVSALPDTTKYAVALSLTINSSTFVMTGQLKDQNGDNLGTAQTIDLPLESVVVGGSYNSQTKKVILTLQNGNTIEFSVADLVSGLQTELSASNKLNPAYIDYDSTHRAVSDTEKSTWNGKQNAIDSSHKLPADLVDDTNATNKFATAEELEQIKTNENNILSLNTDTALLKNTITTIRFSQGVTRTITFPKPNYNMFIVFGFVQGVGLVNWECRSSNDGLLSVRDVLTASSVTQDTITYTRDLNAGTATVTISSNVNQWSYLTIIKNAGIT